jgi:sugar phosphate isomerase/epimerase
VFNLDVFPGFDVRIACSTLLFDDDPLEIACQRIADLGFEAVDVGARSGWAHVDPGTLPGRVNDTVDRIEAACADAGVEPVAFNAAIAGAHDASPAEQVRALGALADALDVDVFTLGCGGDADRPLADAIDRSRRLADAVRDAEATLTHETHTGCLTEDPTVAHRLVAGTPGLQLTLDPSHFWYDADRDRPPDCYDELLPHVAHVHVRQATPDDNGVPMDDSGGRVDFERLVDRLRDVGYDGVLSVEYIGSDAPDDATARMAADARTALAPLV